MMSRLRPQLPTLTAVAVSALFAMSVMSANAHAAVPTIASDCGEIIEITPPSADAARILHADGTTGWARPYQTLLAGDQVVVAKAGAAVRIRVEGRAADLWLTPASPPYKVVSTHGAAPGAGDLAAFLDAWRFVFAPDQATATVSTTPRMAEVNARFPPPSGPQNIRANEALSIPLYWPHDAAARLVDADGATIAQTSPTEKGPRERLDVPPLAPGQYRLIAGGLELPVRALPDEPPKGSPLARAVAAANKLKSDPRRRLQSAADLQALAPEVFVARAVLDWLASSS